MGSENIHNLRGYRFNASGKMYAKPMLYGMASGAGDTSMQTFGFDLNKYQNTRLPNEIFRLDPSDINCIGNLKDGSTVTTIKNFGTPLTTGIVNPTLQLPKFYSYTSGTERQQSHYTAPFLNFNQIGEKGTCYEHRSDSTYSFFHQPEKEYTIYFIASLRLNALAQPFGNVILHTDGLNLGTGIRILLDTNFTLIVAVNNALDQRTIWAKVPVNVKLDSVPVLFSLRCKNEYRRTRHCGWVYINGVKTTEMVSLMPFNPTPTSYAGLRLFRCLWPAGLTFTGGFRGGIGDIRIFNTKHTGQQHTEMCNFLMQKYKIAI